MSQARIVINVSDQEQLHSNGLSGQWIVPGKKKEETFGMLVVYDRSEIQDLGENRRTQNHDWAKSSELAKSIMGVGSWNGSKEKWGLLLCEAEPDLPRELEKAVADEISYLNKHVPVAVFARDQESGALVAVNKELESVSAKKQELSDRVQELRQEFERACRKLVTKAEVMKANQNLLLEDQRLIALGDQIWAGPEPGRINISELHKNACIRRNQQRPWCYIPEQLVTCPGCGASIKENILTCPACAGWLDEDVEVLRKMPPKERAQKMYPERYAEPVGASGKKS